MLSYLFVSVLKKSVLFVPLLAWLGIELLGIHFPGDEDGRELFAFTVLGGSPPVLELTTNEFMEQHDLRRGEKFDRKLKILVH